MRSLDFYKLCLIQCGPSVLEAIVRREDPETLELLITVAGSPLWRRVQTPFGAVTEIENAGIQMMIAGTGGWWR